MSWWSPIVAWPPIGLWYPISGLTPIGLWPPINAWPPIGAFGVPFVCAAYDTVVISAKWMTFDMCTHADKCLVLHNWVVSGTIMDSD